MGNIPTYILEVMIDGTWVEVASMDATAVDYTDPFRPVADNSTHSTRIIEEYAADSDTTPEA